MELLLNIWKIILIIHFIHSLVLIITHYFAVKFKIENKELSDRTEFNMLIFFINSLIYSFFIFIWKSQIIKFD